MTALRNRTLFVSSLEDAATARGRCAGILQLGSVSQGALVACFRSLATLVRAGVSLPRCLGVCIEQSGDRRLRETLRAVAIEIQDGLSLSEAMQRHPRVFSRLLIGTIKAGEQGGALDVVLERLAGALERDRSVRKRIAASLTYPGIVAAATVVVICLLLTTTIPMFASMYAQLHVAVPPLLSALIAFSTALRSAGAWLTIGLAGGAAVLAVLQLRNTAKGRAAIEDAQLALPVIGAILRKASLGRFARMLGTLLACGVNLHSALPVVAEVAGSPRYRASVESLSLSLARGSSIAEPLAASRLYDALFLQLVRVGEETGAIDEMLLRIADYYELDVEIALQQLASALEPVMILFLGGVVGAVAAAVFIPLYSFIGNIK
ncbi:MAG TPA: type II secretion system F family protein [Candidatus Rubrimentiphilum sp.]|nr:type II secretion system F family protein [Candidatus Rubrimentiphilum sp.]